MPMRSCSWSPSILSHGRLPQWLGAGTEALVATSGEVIRDNAGSIDTTGLVTLGPGEPAFTDLIRAVEHELVPDLIRAAPWRIRPV